MGDNPFESNHNAGGEVPPAAVAVPVASGGAQAAAPAAGPKPNPLSRCVGAVTGKIKSTPIGRILIIMRFINLVNAGLLGLSSVMGFMNIDNVYVVYLSVYLAMFSLVLLAFELRLPKWEERFRRLFGFMYSFWGRTLFLVFCGTLNFGIDYWVCILVGVLTLINSFFNCFIICQHPEFKTMLEKSKQETADPAQLTTDQVTAYLQAHPDVANQAVSFAQFSQQPSKPSAPSPAPRRQPPPPSPRRSNPPAATRPAQAAATPPPRPARRSAPPPPTPSDNPFDN